MSKCEIVRFILDVKNWPDFNKSIVIVKKQNKKKLILEFN